MLMNRLLLFSLLLMFSCSSNRHISTIEKLLKSDDLFPLKNSFAEERWRFMIINHYNERLDTCRIDLEFFKKKYSSFDNLSKEEKDNMFLEYHHVVANILGELKKSKIYKHKEYKVSLKEHLGDGQEYIIFHDNDSLTYFFQDLWKVKLMELDSLLNGICAQ